MNSGDCENFSATKIICSSCLNPIQGKLLNSPCSVCGEFWHVSSLSGEQIKNIIKKAKGSGKRGIWKFKSLISCEDVEEVTLGEGDTPIVFASRIGREMGLKRLWIKDESWQPTGTFKDRMASLVISVMKQRGIKEYVIASSGNAAVSFARYCLEAGVELTCFVPEKIEPNRLKTLVALGAKVRYARSYFSAKKMAREYAEKFGLPVSRGVRDLLRRNSYKSIAYEIFLQLGYGPDWYVQAISSAEGVLGVIQGFEELFRAGLISRVPKFLCVEVEGCSPMNRAFKSGLSLAESVDHPETNITVLTGGNPEAYPYLLKYRDLYGGYFSSATDAEALEAQKLLFQKEGILSRTEAAVGIAGLAKAAARGIVQPGECVVYNCTGGINV